MGKKRIKLEPAELMLLDLPTLIIEEILLRVNVRDRKNIRLTCKRLYELCNCPRICMKEKIIWRGIDTNDVNVQQALLKSDRSCYNLVIDCKYRVIDNLKKSTILQFFKANGARVRSLDINGAYFVEEFLEPLIMSCEGLQSLTLSLITREDSSSLDYFTLEPNTITIPTVTCLQLILPEHQPSKYFHRMLSVFPNVKQLKIAMEQLVYYKWTLSTVEKLNLNAAQECSAIFDDIMKCGNNLKSLHLNMPLSQLIAKGSQFREALSNLKDSSIQFNGDTTLSEPENLYSSFSNLASLELLFSRGFQLKRLLENTPLNYLKISGLSNSPVVFNEECFKALVSSKLRILRFEELFFESAPMAVLDSPLEANATVTDLYLNTWWRTLESSGQLFSMYFRGLVHLQIFSWTDAILQCIFQYQQNLRSLELRIGQGCSNEGFWGSKDGRFEYSINNLQKLEHLSIFVPLNIIGSDEFENVFKLPRLECLRIDGLDSVRNCHVRVAKIRPEWYKNLTNLRALRIEDLAMPSEETISSLFTNLKYLNYLRFDLDRNSIFSKIHAVTFINAKAFSINIEEYKYAYTLGQTYYDKELDRMVSLNDGLNQILYSPKISSYEIEWIKA